MEKIRWRQVFKLNFDSQEVNNLSITIRNMIEKSNVPSIQAELSQILKSVDRSGGKAEQLHNVYKTVNDLNYTLKGNLNKTANDRLLIAATETIKNDLTKIFSVNADFVKANKKYQAYTKAYFEPLEKLTRLIKPPIFFIGFVFFQKEDCIG